MKKKEKSEEDFSFRNKRNGRKQIHAKSVLKNIMQNIREEKTRRPLEGPSRNVTIGTEKMHSQKTQDSIKCFIRFNWKEDTTKEYLRTRPSERGPI